MVRAETLSLLENRDTLCGRYCTVQENCTFVMTQTSWAQQETNHFFGGRKSPSQKQCDEIAQSMSGASTVSPVDSPMGSRRFHPGKTRRCWRGDNIVGLCFPAKRRLASLAVGSSSANNSVLSHHHLTCHNLAPGAHPEDKR